MNPDSMNPQRSGWRTLWSVPMLVVQLAIVALVAVAVIVLSRRGDADPLRHVRLAASALSVVGLAALAGIVTLARHHRRVPLVLVVGVSMTFAAYVCSFLAELPANAGLARALTVAYWGLSLVALPMILGGAWHVLRADRGAR